MMEPTSFNATFLVVDSEGLSVNVKLSVRWLSQRYRLPLWKHERGVCTVQAVMCGKKSETQKSSTLSLVTRSTGSPLCRKIWGCRNGIEIFRLVLLIACALRCTLRTTGISRHQSDSLWDKALYDRIPLWKRLCCTMHDFSYLFWMATGIY